MDKVIRRQIPAQIFVLAVAYFAVSMFDVGTTVIALEYGGIEANPLMAAAGQWWITVKVAVVLGVILWASWKHRYKMLWIANVVTGAVVISNITKIGELIWK